MFGSSGSNSGNSSSSSSGSSRSDNIFQAMSSLKEAFDPRSRIRVARGDVRTAVLALLAEQPMHGYQMMSEIELRTEGKWKPSAGSIYPTLQLLTDEGLVTADASAGKKTYSLTESGTVEATEAATAAPWIESEKNSHPKLKMLPKASVALAQTIAQVGQNGTDEQIEKAVELLDETRRSLYAILATK